jgi:broad specificity phosphatase PhoE
MKLLLIRHGQSLGNAEGRVQGIFDSPLSDEGRAQARALGRRLEREGWQLAAVYASDLSRALETAEIVMAGFDVPIVPDARLREYDAGVLNGIIWKEVEHRYPEIWHGLQHSPVWVPIPGEEGAEAFHERLAAALADIRSRHGEGEEVALVSHGGSLGMILTHLLGLDVGRHTPFHFGNASLSIVEFGRRGPFLRLMNDTCHLEGNHR